MNFSVLEQELALLPPEQQDRLSAFLTFLRMRHDRIISDITRRLDDKTQQNWSSWDDVKADLANELGEEAS